MQIIPAILTDKPSELIELIEQIKQSKKFNRVQIDFVDGEYAANKSIRVEDLPADRQGLEFDAHLMVVEKNIKEYALAAKNFGFDRIIAQVESISHPEGFSCLAMDFHSPVTVVRPYLPQLDLVVVMSVEPGFGGQKFSAEAIELIKQLIRSRKEKNYPFRICVDGGIEKQHLPSLKNLGVDEVAVGAKRVLEW